MKKKLLFCEDGSLDLEELNKQIKENDLPYIPILYRQGTQAPYILDGYSTTEKNEILTSKEREYLSAVIKPFRNATNVYFCKQYYDYNSKNEYVICFAYKDTYVHLPRFDDINMYKGMILDKKYTLEELGL